MSAGGMVFGQGGALVRRVRWVAHLVRRWRLRAETAQIVRDPYGEPPFPLTRQEWAELCRYEAERREAA